MEDNVFCLLLLNSYCSSSSVFLGESNEERTSISAFLRVCNICISSRLAREKIYRVSNLEAGIR